jgi:small subunit ribosomal protein S9
MSITKKVANTIFATGRRKKAVSRVRILKGTGKIIVNGKNLTDYFPAGNYEMIVRQPLNALNFKDDYDIIANVYGGGLSGQAGALRHSISRAFDELDDKNHNALKSLDLLTRDPRMVERKKYGHKKARKRFQFSKR